MSLISLYKKKSQTFKYKKTLLLLIVVLAVAFLLGKKTNNRTPENLTPAQVNKMLEGSDFVFVNVHTPYEGEIEKTDVFISFDALVANKNLLPKDKSKTIILYCKTGSMSKQALRTLAGMGYKNISHLEGGMEAWKKSGFEVLNLAEIPEQVIPPQGVSLPITWGNIGPKLVANGVIDMAKLEKVLSLTPAQRRILLDGTEEQIVIDSQNSQFVVDLLWALGLAQKSSVYTQGPMGTDYKNTIGNFASTGGWTLGKRDAVTYLNKYDFLGLTPEEHERVMAIAGNVYRPCCGNHTAFPDCNHGMAALAAIELMVAKGLGDDEIYKNILALNSYWFSGHYITVATYYARNGTNWAHVNAKEILSENISSGKAAGEFAKAVGPLPYAGIEGGSCGA